MSVLELRGVGFPNNPRSHLRSVNLSLEAGEAVALFGRSGIGKGTLLKIASGLVIPGAGTVVLGDEAGGRRVPVSYIPRSGGLLSNMTLIHNAALPAVWHGLLAPGEAQGRAEALFEEFGISAQGGSLPGLVGSGARLLAQVARAFLCDPAVMVLDEPFAEPDAAVDHLVAQAIQRFKALPGRAVLLAAGQLGPAQAIADRFGFLRPEGLEFFAGRSQLVSSPDPEVREFLE